MASALDKEHVKEVIDTFYKVGRNTGWNREVNEKVAEVFGLMLEEAKKCTDALNWVPRPPGGKATIAWLVRTLGRIGVAQMRNGLSKTCALAVIRNWDRELSMASSLG